jgi:hypothetical protein
MVVIAGCSEGVREQSGGNPEIATVISDVDQPARRTVAMTNIAVSATQAATFEQIHPVPGVITLSTTAKSPSWPVQAAGRGQR